MRLCIRAPSILYISDPVTQGTTGIFSIKDVFLAGGGIHIENTGGGGVDGVSIDGGLMEGAKQPFLTLRTGANASGISGVEVRNVHLADSIKPFPALIDAHVSPNAMGYIRNVMVMNCFTDGPALTTGDPIYGLEVWSAQDYAPGVIAQKDHFIYHGPSGIKDTIKRLP